MSLCITLLHCLGVRIPIGGTLFQRICESQLFSVRRRRKVLGKILRAAGENFWDFKRERTGFHTILSPFVLKAIKASLYVCEGRYVTQPNSINTTPDGKHLEKACQKTRDVAQGKCVM